MIERSRNRTHKNLFCMYHPLDLWTKDSSNKNTNAKSALALAHNLLNLQLNVVAFNEGRRLDTIAVEPRISNIGLT